MNVTYLVMAGAIEQEMVEVNCIIIDVRACSDLNSGYFLSIISTFNYDYSLIET
jgi:hypothetical protein